MDETKKIDLKNTEVRELNRMLQKRDGNNFNYFNIINPMGAHAIATGLDNEIDVLIDGHVGYYCAGMNQQSIVTINGNAGVGVAPSVAFTSPIVTLSATETAAAGSATGLSLSNVG